MDKFDMGQVIFTRFHLSWPNFFNRPCSCPIVGWVGNRVCDLNHKSSNTPHNQDNLSFYSFVASELRNFRKGGQYKMDHPLETSARKLLAWISTNDSGKNQKLRPESP